MRLPLLATITVGLAAAPAVQLMPVPPAARLMPAPAAWLAAPPAAWLVAANHGGLANVDLIDHGVLWIRDLEEGKLDLGMERSIHAVPEGRFGWRRAPFASLKKQAETLFWLIYCERKTLFRLKKTS